MPTEASRPSSSGSPASGGSCCTSSSTSSQYPKSFGKMVLNDLPDASTKRVSACGRCPQAALSRQECRRPRCPGPGHVTRDANAVRGSLRSGLGSLSTMNARPIAVTRVVRACETWNPLSGSGPSYGNLVPAGTVGQSFRRPRDARRPDLPRHARRGARQQPVAPGQQQERGRWHRGLTERPAPRELLAPGLHTSGVMRGAWP